MFYDLIAFLCSPSSWWGRLRVLGLELVPEQGPIIVVPNHDSQFDPTTLGLAIRPKRRLRYLAMLELWKIPVLGLILNGMRQIPVLRGTGDARALEHAVAALKAGDAVAIFPEGRLTWGETLRARSGVGLLAMWVPEARVVLATIEGTVDYVRWPKRPRVTVTFFEPAGGQFRPGEEPAAFAARLLKEIRDRVPPTPAGRKAIVGGPPRIQRYNARLAARSRNGYVVPASDSASSGPLDAATRQDGEQA